MVIHTLLTSNVVVYGISNGETYDLANGDPVVTISEGTATLNGIAFTSNSVVNQAGDYILLVQNLDNGIITVNFTIIGLTSPTVYGAEEGVTYTNLEAEKTITFSNRTATLNSNPFSTGSSISATNNYTLTVTNTSNSTSTIHFTYIKYGDVTGDGIIDLYDLSRVKSHLLKISRLTGAYLLAGDTNQNGNVTIADLIIIKKKILMLP